MNQDIRQRRRQGILEAALEVYIESGYNGADMDLVAERAGLAKGLLYYYFASKQELFRALFDWAAESSMGYHRRLIAEGEGLSPTERLALYLWSVLTAHGEDARLLQFAMRMPFDAFAVYGPSGWEDGRRKSEEHSACMAAMIEELVAAGAIAVVDAKAAANCLWTVVVAKAFSFAKMIDARPSGQEGRDAAGASDDSAALEAMAFCFRGLGLGPESWQAIVDERREGKA
jgi:Transcriptional regulator